MKGYDEFCPVSYNTYPVSKRKKKRELPYTQECNDILTFDIEVSTAYMDENGDLIPYHPYETEEYWNSKRAYSLCYIWQFSFNDEIYYGRELSDFRKVLDALPPKTHFIIWVHNLSYEFEFLNNILTWESTFARNAHKPMKAVPLEYPNIEFRCSYFLTRLSLDSWGKEIGIHKLSGFLDYTKIRTPKTTLTDKELAYCSRDCEVVYKGILKYIDKYKNVVDIPLTQTGEVRRVIKKKMLADDVTAYWMQKLIPENAYMYSIMKETFMGGYTHANFTLAGRTIRTNYGCAFDFASSYPAVMCSEKFPVTPFIRDVFDFNKIDKIAYLMKVKFYNVEGTKLNHYIPTSKCHDVKGIHNDNGRVISAEELTIWITEQDFEIICRSYNFTYVVLECYSSRKQYLPKELVEYVFELYNNKTQYKGIPDKADIYAVSKQFINSLFGMTVTDIIQDSVLFDGDEWHLELKTKEDVEKYLRDLKTNNKRRTFLAYQFGIWITAYARHNLWECLLSCDEDVIYSDTDSLKIRKKYNFDWYNQKIKQKIEDCCNFHKLPVSMASPVDKFGVPHPLGHFDEEDPWTEFKTLGAKRYCYRGKKDGRLHLTVSGISKQAVVCLKDDIDNFNEDAVFDKDYWERFSEDVSNGNYWIPEHAGYTLDEIKDKFHVSDGTKKMHQYCKMSIATWKKGEYDEYVSNYTKGIAMRNTSYSMSITDEYFHLIFADSLNHLNCI